VLTRYREVLREPYVARLLVTAMLGRLPQGMTGLAILLLLTPSVGYGKAGIGTGLSLAGSGVANVVLARAVDRVGPRVVLAPAAAAYLCLAIALATVAHRGYAVALVLCAALGMTAAPVSSVSRGTWPRLLSDDHAQVIYGLEATAQELVFIAGPAVVALVAGLANAKAALVLSGAFGLIGVVGFVSAPTFAPGDRLRSGGATRTSLLRSRVMAYAFVGIALTTGFSMTEIATVAFVSGRHATAASGVVLAIWSVGSLLGGLVFGAGASRVGDRGLAAAVALTGVGLLLATAAPGKVGLTVILFVAGAANAPSLARLYTRVRAVAPPSAMTESFGWLAVGFQVGSSLGAALGGLAVDGVGARWSFALAGAAALTGLVVTVDAR
jgi:predicted MFS family arabinose efflux permease